MEKKEIFYGTKKCIVGVEEMGQPLRRLLLFQRIWVRLQHPGRVADNRLQLQVQGIQCHILAFAGTCTYVAYAHTDTDIHTHKYK